MRLTNIGKSMLIVTTFACFAINVSQAEAMGSGQRNNGGVLSPSASPYALLAPITISGDPNEGRAAFQGRSSLCPAGEYEIPTGTRLRCKPAR
jgi:hypothetical protein